jgi:hypothetical protein
MFELMGFDPALANDAAAPTYPCLLDELHELAAHFGIVNVPTAVWIDEDGHVVRAPETPGVSDAFRAMNLVTREVPERENADRKLRRRIYMDAVRDWIQNGAASRHVLAPDEVRQRMRGTSERESRATAHFQLGIWLARRGARDAAQRELETAVRLQPESWRFRRQKIVLSDPTLVGRLAITPEFWQAVRALGTELYYPQPKMDGMPPPLVPGG